MEGKKPDENEDRLFSETPEDVAVLYSWANLRGAQYRDFSASRREFRAQMRKRAAETQKEAELRAKSEAEAAAFSSERAAREAEEAARFHETAARRAFEEQRQYDSQQEEQARVRAIEHAAELSRRAAVERMEAGRRAEAIAAAEAAARREERELAAARASAVRQAARYTQSEAARRKAVGPQPAPVVHGAISDPYTDVHPSGPPERVYREPAVPEGDLRPAHLPRAREVAPAIPQPEESVAVRADRDYWAGYMEERRDAALEPELSASEPSRAPVNYYYEPDSQEKVAAVDQYAQYAPYTETQRRPEAEEVYPPVNPAAKMESVRPLSTGTTSTSSTSSVESLYEDQSEESAPGQAVPAWISSQQPSQMPAEPRPQRPVAAPVGDTLQQSRERVAARWYALKGAFDQSFKEPHAQPSPSRARDGRVPVTAVFSVAGGVGKTSMVATLGRALSSLGEQVLLVDTTLHGLLPFYFSASDLRSGSVRQFTPPEGSNHAPISLVSYDVADRSGDTASEEWLGEELRRSSQEAQRMLVDLSPSTPWIARLVARMNSNILVPVAPDMNSVISLGAVERFFAGMADSEGRSVQPYYLLNQFDSSLPLHLDVREVLRQKLGDRLLPFVIRRSPAMSEALAEGMTLMDYAPDAPVAGDYMNLASWLRTESAPAASGLKNARWSER